MNNNLESNATEYFRRELKKVGINLERAKSRNATKAELMNLRNKCEYFKEAIILFGNGETEIPYDKLNEEEIDLISEVIYKPNFVGLEKRKYECYNGEIMSSLIAHFKNGDERNAVTRLEFNALEYGKIYGGKEYNE